MILVSLNKKLFISKRALFIELTFVENPIFFKFSAFLFFLLKIIKSFKDFNILAFPAVAIYS